MVTYDVTTVFMEKIQIIRINYCHQVFPKKYFLKNTLSEKNMWNKATEF